MPSPFPKSIGPLAKVGRLDGRPGVNPWARGSQSPDGLIYGTPLFGITVMLTSEEPRRGFVIP
jgi:hypothetical protein